MTSEMLVKAIWRVLLSQEIQYSSRTQANTDQFKRVQQILWALAERARDLGISEETVVRHVMLKATVEPLLRTMGGELRKPHSPLWTRWRGRLPAGNARGARQSESRRGHASGRSLASLLKRRCSSR